MFCKKCGTANDEDARFCKGCGAPMNGSVSFENGSAGSSLGNIRLFRWLGFSAAIMQIISIFLPIYCPARSYEMTEFYEPKYSLWSLMFREYSTVYMIPDLLLLAASVILMIMFITGPVRNRRLYMFSAVADIIVVLAVFVLLNLEVYSISWTHYRMGTAMALLFVSAVIMLVSTVFVSKAGKKA